MAAHELLKPLDHDRGVRHGDPRAQRPRARPRHPAGPRHARARLLAHAAARRDAADRRAPQRRAAAAPGRRPRRDRPRLPRDARRRHPGAHAHVDIDPLPVVDGNPALLSRRVRQPALQRAQVRAADGGEIHVSAERDRRGLDVRGREPRPRDPRARPRAHLRAVGARAPASAARAARASGWRSCAGWSSATAAESASPRRPTAATASTSRCRPRGGQLRPGSAAHPLRGRRRLARASARRACAGCSSRASAPSRSRARARSAIWSVVRPSASEVDDLPLARRQRRLDRPQAAGAVRRLAQLLDQPHAHPARDRGLAVERAAQRLRQHVDVDVLGQEARRAGAQRRAGRSRRRRPLVSMTTTWSRVVLRGSAASPRSRRAPA